MIDCPKCLAPNAIKKIHKDGYIAYICEYCESVMEDTMIVEGYTTMSENIIIKENTSPVKIAEPVTEQEQPYFKNKKETSWHKINMVPVVRTLEKECANCRYFLYTRLSRLKNELEVTMSKILFSPKQVLQLQKNPNVQQVSERTITYTDTFKSQFIDEYFAGKTPRQFLRNMALMKRQSGSNVLNNQLFVGVKHMKRTA